jgi:FHA domain/Transcriptional regulatory protein, C terminal
MADAFEFWVQRDGRPAVRLPFEGPVVLGRDPGCEVVLDSQFISRRHARVEASADGYVLVDEGSRNGTLLNGERLRKPARLEPGDEIRIADFVIYYRRPGDPESTQAWDPSLLASGGAPPGLYVDVTGREVWILGEKMTKPLSKQEFDLLSLLYERSEEVVGKDAIGGLIWGAGNYDDNMLHRLLFRLKEKIEPDPAHPRFVVNVPGVGYKLRRVPPDDDGSGAL